MRTAVAAVTAALLPLLASCDRPRPATRVPPVGADFRPEFQRGVCFTHNHSLDRGYGSDMAARSLAEVRALGANFVSVSPIGYAYNLHDPRIVGYTGEDLTMTPDRVRATIRAAHAAGLKVLLAPHLWIGFYGAPGEWRGNIEMKSESDWRAWFESYRGFITFFARMAEEEGVELFCVGSELRRTTAARPDDWRRIIHEVRGIYRGPCTYGANWDGEFETIPFWDELEYVGLSAYFPLAEAEAVRDRLRAFSAKWRKPVLFVESGFRSVRGAGAQPSAWGNGGEVDFEEQRAAYARWAGTFWDEPWFFGLYWWQWFADLDYAPEPPTDYQFRHKPAEAVVRDLFAKPRPQ